MKCLLGPKKKVQNNNIIRYIIKYRKSSLLGVLSLFLLLQEQRESATITVQK